MGETNLRLIVRQYLLEFWWRRWTILLIVWAVCAAGWLWVISLPDRYTASAKVYIDTQTILNPLMSGLAVRPDIDQQIDMMRRTLLTRPNLEELARATDLDLRAESPAEMDGLINALRQRIVLSSDGRQLMIMEFEDEDPALAQRVVQSLLSIFVEQNVGNNRRDIERTRRFIDTQIAEYEQRLRDAERDVSEFRHRHAAELQAKDGAIRQLATLELDKRQLDTEMQAAIWQRDQLLAELARTPEFLTGADALMVQRSPAAQRVAELEGQIASLRLRVTNQHPDLVALNRQLQNARAEMTREIRARGEDPNAEARIPNPAHRRLQDELRRVEFGITSLRQRIDQNHTEMTQLRQRVDDVPQVELQLAQMNRDYEILRRNYNELTGRRESAYLAQQLDDQTTNVEFRVVEPPVEPTSPTGPNRLLLLAGVLGAGLAAGFGVAFARVQMQDSFMSVGKLRESFDIPVIGSVSRVESAGNRSSRLATLPGLIAGLGGLLVVFGALVYLYHFAAAGPDLAGLASRLHAQLQFTTGS